MYNRYIPQPDGSYRRNRIPERNPPQKKPAAVCPPEKKPEEKVSKNNGCGQKAHPCPPPKPEDCPKEVGHAKLTQPLGVGSFFKNILPKDFDTSDLVVLLLLLLMAGDCEEDKNTALLTLVLYLFL